MSEFNSSESSVELGKPIQPSHVKSSFKGPFSFLKSSSVVLFIVIASVFLIVFFVLWQRIVVDSMPRIYEVQQQKTASIAARFLAFAQRQDDLEIVKLSHLKETPEQNYLSRWPLNEEIFVGGAKSPFLIGRYDDETLWKREIGNLNEFWKIEDGLAYLITIGGLNLGSSRPELLSVHEGMKRETIDELFRGGLAAGVRAFKDGKRQKLVAHREIPNTNVVVFVEAYVDTILANKWSEYLKVSVQLLVAALSAFGIGFYLFSKLSRSFTHLLREADAIGDDKMFAKKFEFSDEFFRLGRVMSFLHERLEIIRTYRFEEREVRRFSYQFLTQTSRVKNFEDHFRIFGDLISRFHPEFNGATVYVYLLDVGQEIQDSQSRLFARYCLVKAGAPVLVMNRHVVHCSEVSEMIANGEGKDQFVDFDDNQLICELSSGSRSWGYLSVEHPNVDGITPETRRRLLFVIKIFSNSAFRFIR